MRKTLDLNDIRTFEAVAKAGSITGAAKELEQPASTVSRSLTRLEECLGVLLVRRTQRGLTVTEAGKRYLVSCKSALRSLREGGEGLEAQRTNPSGTLRIAAPVCFAKNTLSPLLSSFLGKYPELRIEIDLYSSGWDKEPEDELDVYFKVRAPKDSTKRCRLYPEILQGVFASPRYLAKHGTPNEPSSLASHRCIGLLPEGGFDLWRLSKERSRVTPETDLVAIASDPEIHRQLAVDGAGIAVLPLWLATQPGMANKLTRLMPLWRPPSITLCALYSGSSRLTPKIEAFLNYIEPYIGTDRDPCLHGAQGKLCFSQRKSKVRKN
ncbi:LysR family transcriptional regulator [Acidicapsa ligni]|uniref:LysR family transcriptional regulator n=1 Tax=Acidicapsa ligni TaxID=542300 RepID=UPI0021DFC408|nr:LysR family transcriptional regulator [Acidicapsa ligni]